MKKVVKKLKQSLSILLAVAMVVTCVPQTATSVFAAEPDVVADGTVDETAVDTPDAAADTGSDETVADPAGTETARTDENADDAASEDGVDTPAQSGAEETEQPAADAQDDAQEQDAPVDEATETATIGLYDGGIALTAFDALTTANVKVFVDDTAQGDTSIVDFTAGAYEGSGAYTFTLKVSDAQKDNYYLEKVKYAIAGNDTALAEATSYNNEIDTHDEDAGTWTIPSASLNTVDGGTQKLYIAAVVREMQTVTLDDFEAGKFSGAKYGFDISEVDAAKCDKNITDGTIKVPKNYYLGLKLTAAEGYAKPKVKVDSEDITDEDGLYKIGQITDSSKTVTITVAKQYHVTITANQDGEKDVIDTNANKYALDASEKTQDEDLTSEGGWTSGASFPAEENQVLSFQAKLKGESSYNQKYDLEVKAGESALKDDDNNNIYHQTITGETNITLTPVRKAFGVKLASDVTDRTVKIGAGSSAGTPLRNTDEKVDVLENVSDGHSADDLAIAVEGVDGQKEVEVTYTLGDASGDAKEVTMKDAAGDESKKNWTGTIDAEKITDDVTLTVKVQDPVTAKVKYKVKPDGTTTDRISKVYYAVDADIPAESPNKLNDTGADLKKGQTFTLRVEPKTGYIVTGVTRTTEGKSGDVKIDPVEGKDNTFAFTPGATDMPDTTSKAITLTISTALDPDANNKAALAAGSRATATWHKESGTVLDEKNSNINNDPSGRLPDTETQLVTSEGTVYAVISPADGYTINGAVTGTGAGATVTDLTQEKINDDEYEVESSAPTGLVGDHVVKIVFGAAKTLVTLTVPTEAAGAESQTTITFAEDENLSKKAGLSFTVTNAVKTATETAGEIIADAKDAKKFVAEEGAKLLEFDVTVNEGWTPSAVYSKEEEEQTEQTIESTTADQKTYSFSIPVSLLNKAGTDDTLEGAKAITITLDADVAYQTLKVSYDENAVKLLTMTVNGETQNETKQDYLKEFTKNKSMQFDHNDVITFTAYPKANCEITGINGTNAKITSSSDPNGTWTFTVTADGLNYLAEDGKTPLDAEVEIAVAKAYRASLKAGGEEPAKDAKTGAYLLDENETYNIVLTQGNDEKAAISKVEFTQKQGSREVSLSMNGIDVKTGDSATVNFKDTVKKEDYQKNFNFNLFVKEKKEVPTADGKTETKEEDVKVELEAPLTAVLRKAVTSIDVKDGKKSVKGAEVEITADTVKTFTVSTNDNANVSQIHAAVDEAGQAAKIEAGLENGILTVTMPQDTKAAGKISLYTGDAKKKENEVTFTVKAKDQLEDKTPGANAKDVVASDTYFQMNVSLPKNTEKTQGTLYYEVKVTPDAAAAAELKDEQQKKAIQAVFGDKMEPRAFYVPVDGKTTLAASQSTGRLTVIDKELTTLKEGFPFPFSAEVRLVAPVEKEKTAIETANEKGITATTPLAADNFYSVSNAAKAVDFETKTPYYEEKLKVKKGTTTIYTGQGTQDSDDGNGVLIATAQWGKSTSFMDLDKDKTKDYEGYDGALEITPVGDKVYAKANTDTSLGKHTIRIVATAKDGMAGAETTVTVTVVQGIEGIRVDVPSDQIYKAGNKAATLKAAAVYNDNETKPKTAKVTWSVIAAAKEDGAALEPDTNDPSSLNDAVPFAGVTIKNGTVTVDKNYVPKNTAAEGKYANSFYIVARADDFNASKAKAGDEWATNETFGVSRRITISSTAMDLGILAVGEPQYDTYDVVTEYTNVVTGGSLEKKDLAGKQLIVLKSGKTVGGEGTVSADDVLPVGNFTYKSSNGQVKVDKETGEITDVLKEVKNVKLTATADDGSKKAVTMTFNVGNTSAEELGLEIQTLYEATHYTNYDKDRGTLGNLDVKGTAGTVFALSLVKKTNGFFDTPFDTDEDMTDAKVSVKNGKLVGDVKDGSARLTLTKQSADVTLTYSVNGAKKTKTYQVTNSGLDTVNLAKSPSLKLKGGPVIRYGTNNTYGVYTGTFTAPRGADSGFFDGMVVKVEPDYSAANAKNLYSYEGLMDGSELIKVNENGTFTLTIATRKYPAAGSYKLKLTLGKESEGATRGMAFEPSYQAASASIKIQDVKTAKPSVKLASSYKMSLSNTSVQIAPSGKNFTRFAVTNGKGREAMIYDGSYGESPVLLNANVNGAANRFSEFFAITDNDSDTTVYPYNQTYTLSLDTAKLAEEWAKEGNEGKGLKELIGQNNTGFIEYQYANDMGGTIEVKTLKITVNLTDDKTDKNGVTTPATTVKYSASKAKAKASLAKDVELGILEGKYSARLAYAFIEDSMEDYSTDAKTEGKAMLTGDSDPSHGMFKVLAKSKGTAPKAGTHKLTLRIVPEGSYGEAVIDKLSSDKEKQAEAIKKYGVVVKTTVTVVADDARMNLINVKAKDLKFKRSQYLSSGNNTVSGVWGNYSIEGNYSTSGYPYLVDFTTSGTAYIKKIELDETSAPDLKGLLSFYVMSDWGTGGHIVPLLNKDAFEAKATSLEGQTYNNVKVNVTFGRWDYTNNEVKEEPTVEKQTLTFKVTLPDDKKDTYEHHYSTVEELAAAIDKDGAEYKDVTAVTLPTADRMKQAKATDNDMKRLGEYPSGSYDPSMGVTLGAVQSELRNVWNAITNNIHMHFNNQSDLRIVVDPFDLDKTFGNSVDAQAKSDQYLGASYDADHGEIQVDVKLYECKCTDGKHLGEPTATVTYKFALDKMADIKEIAEDIINILNDKITGSAETAKNQRDMLLVTNKTTEKELLDFVKGFNGTISKEINMPETLSDATNTSVRIYVDTFDLTPATTAKTGNLEVAFRIHDTKLSSDNDVYAPYGYDDDYDLYYADPKSYTIDKLQTESDIATKITTGDLKDADGEAFVATNNTTEQELLDAVNRAVKALNEDASAAYAKQDDGENAGKNWFILKRASEGTAATNKGSLEAKFVITNPRSGQTPTDESNVLTLTFTIDALKSAENVLKAVKEAVGYGTNGTGEADQAIKDIISAVREDIAKNGGEALKDNDSRVEAALQKAADDAVKADPYTATIDAFAFTPNGYNTADKEDKSGKVGDGSISFTVTFGWKEGEEYDAGGKAKSLPPNLQNKEGVGGVTYNFKVDSKLPADPTLITLDEAKALVKAVADKKAEWQYTVLTNTTDDEEALNELIEDELTKALKFDGTTNGTGLTIEVVSASAEGEETTFKAATVKAKAYYKFVYKLEKGEEPDKETLFTSDPIEIESEKLVEQSLSEAKTAVETAVEDMTISNLSTVSNDTRKKAVEDEILVEAAKVINDKYDIRVKEGSRLTVTQDATVNVDGKASITLQIRDTSETEEKWTDIAIADIKIDALDQTDAEAVAAVEAAIDLAEAELTKTILEDNLTDTKDGAEIITLIKGKLTGENELKDSKYQIVLKELDAEKNVFKKAVGSPEEGKTTVTATVLVQTQEGAVTVENGTLEFKAEVKTSER